MSRKDLLQAQARVLRDHPEVGVARVVTGRHPKLVLEYLGRRTCLGYPFSPSDVRSTRNHVAELRRAIRHLKLST